LSEGLIKKILQESKVIAVVGLSRDENKPSHDVALYMKKNGYRIIPVNPFAEEVLGEKSYISLLDIPGNLQERIEIVDIFRRSNDVPPIVDQAIELHKKYGTLKVVWMQLDIVNENAAKKAREEGLDVIMDKCMKVEHRRLSERDLSESTKQQRG
jgi:predicted CoA-binding protein